MVRRRGHGDGEIDRRGENSWRLRYRRLRRHLALQLMPAEMSGKRPNARRRSAYTRIGF
jgi:hypothetical protein